MTKLYLSAPYMGKENQEVKENIERAIIAAAKLRDRGFNVFLPHGNFVYCLDLQNNFESRKKIYQLCNEWIEVCDVIAFMPGWKRSDGCCSEFKEACRFHKKIMYLTVNDL